MNHQLLLLIIPLKQLALRILNFHIARQDIDEYIMKFFTEIRKRPHRRNFQRILATWLATLTIVRALILVQIDLISYFKQFICKLQLQILSYFRKGSKWPKIELVVQFWANCAQFLVYFGVSMTRKAQALRRNGISLRSWTRPFTFSFNFQTKTHISNKTLIKQPPKNPVLLSFF